MDREGSFYDLFFIDSVKADFISSFEGIDDAPYLLHVIPN